MARKLAKTTQRGYGTAHQNLRKRVERDVQAGIAACWRCQANGLPHDKALIKPDEPWDLGHDDNDRTKYRGPEHRKCNRATAGRRTTAVDTTRTW
jgi:hypothetical protein